MCLSSFVFLDPNGIGQSSMPTMTDVALTTA